MSKWRELKYYAKGTPTKTTIRHRRRHLFQNVCRYKDFYRSVCGIFAFGNRFSEGSTDAQKCGHCAKAMGGKK